MDVNIQNKRPTLFNVTNILVFLYLVVFLIGQLLELRTGYPELIMRFGLDADSVIVGHQYWRLITNSFVHAGMLHVFFNAYFIFVIGTGIERLLGAWRYLALVIVTILTSSGMVVLHQYIQGIDYITVGASGFGYGLVGLLAGFAILYPNRYYKAYVLRLLSNILLYSLIFLMTDAAISWAGHLGGFIGGLITALVLNAFFRKEEW